MTGYVYGAARNRENARRTARALITGTRPTLLAPPTPPDRDAFALTEKRIRGNEIGPKETAVVHALAQDKTGMIAAEEFGISYHAFNTRVRKLYAIHGVSKRMDIIMAWLRSGRLCVEDLALPADPRRAHLSAREAVVVTMLRDGLQQAQVAARLGLSENTISDIIKAVKRRWGVRTVEGLVCAAIRVGLVNIYREPMEGTGDSGALVQQRSA